MRQEYEDYTDEQTAVWSILFNRQVQNLTDKASTTYLNCLQDLHPIMTENAIPRFSEFDVKLEAATGWTIEVVPGLIPVADFFELLSQCKFCSSTWLRSMVQLDYLEEPDMFHDIFGHVPLLLHQGYADFMQSIGQLGYACRNHSFLLDVMERVYWYSIEFGLVRSDHGPKIYGAGTLSSYGETNVIFEGDSDIRPFDLDEIMNMPFIKSELQSKYYVIDSLEQLYDSLKIIEVKLKEFEQK